VRPPAAVAAGTAGLVFATSATPEGGPAAALALEADTVLGRLLEQLGTLGVRQAWVVTRPAWQAALEAVAARSALDVRVLPSRDLAQDLERAAEVASGARGRLLLARAETLIHREALAGLLADPRIRSGILVSSSPLRGGWSFRTRSARGRVVSAASAYHRLRQAGPYFLGILKVDAADRDALVAAARRLAGLAGGAHPPRWEAELERKAAEWRLELSRDADGEPAPVAEARLAERVRVAREDAVSLLLVGLVRSDAQLASTHLRGFFYARPLSAAGLRRARAEMAEVDEDRVALSSAVKGSDGFFTTFFVSPYSKYIARFAARRGWTPNAMTTVSMVIGALAAAAFAVGTRPSLVAGAILLQAAFTVDCVDGQLARYTRTFSKLGAWLDSVFDRGKEYLVYAGLAIGASRGFDQDVWALAAAALTLQTTRHMLDFSYSAGQKAAIATSPRVPLEEPEDAPLAIDLPPADADGGAAARAGADAPPAPAPRPATRAPRAPRRGLRARVASVASRIVRLIGRLDRWAVTRWGKRIFVLPIGERFALISLTAALATPRVTFVALLAWGGLAAAYSLFGRVVRSLAR